MLSVLGLPAAAGVAICVRLYDVDVVINRTLVYGGLTAILAGAYLGSVLLLQLVLSPVSSSDFAIAASTLAVAALFRPARNRSKPSLTAASSAASTTPQRTLERLKRTPTRRSVDLDALANELRNTAIETMRPAHVSIWMRPR